jgi:cholesterol transport system auxiliary component
MRNRTMERRIFLAGAAALALSGCSSDLIGPPPSGQIYPVSPRFPAPAQGGTNQKAPWALSINRPDVPGGMAGDRIALFQPDSTQDFYANATYPDRLPSLVQRALLDGFETSGRIDAVAREQDALHADYELLTEVKDFAAHYAVQDGVPTVTMAITAKLVTAHARKIVATLAVTHSASAGANSAAATAQALSGLLGQCVGEIVAWALSQPAPAQPAPAAASGSSTAVHR